MARAAGPGSTTARRAAFDALMGRATAAEQDYVRGLILGGVRQGAQDGVMLAAIAQAAGGAARGGPARGVDACGIRRPGGAGGPGGGRGGVGRGPTRGRAAAAPDARRKRARCRRRGHRRGGGHPRTQDRRHPDSGPQERWGGPVVHAIARRDHRAPPEVVDVVAALPSEEIVLDGETVAVRPDGRPGAVPGHGLTDGVEHRSRSAAGHHPAGDELLRPAPSRRRGPARPAPGPTGSPGSMRSFPPTRAFPGRAFPIRGRRPRSSPPRSPRAMRVSSSRTRGVRMPRAAAARAGSR